LYNENKTSLIRYPEGKTNVFFAIPGSVTSIGEQAFSYCKSLTSVDIPVSVTGIGNNAFLACSSLTSVIIPDSVTSIGGAAFYGCRSLANVTIGASVTSIGDQAFRSCSSLTGVTCNATMPPTLGVMVFNNTTIMLQIKVPSGSVSAYQSATNWSDYSTRISGI
jgi:UDP-N-acetylenolpyruvoylglucosamine reductase